MRERPRRRQLSVILSLGPALAAAALALSIAAPPASAEDFGYELTDLELLGKNFFFDKQLSTPRGKQSCASCHEPKVGWMLPLSNVNKTTVGAPGAQPGEQGRRKVQQNAYASFSPEFGPGGGPRGLQGGNFWDGRAEGCGKPTEPGNPPPPPPPNDGPDCQLGAGGVSETITPEDLPLDDFGDPLHVEDLGPTADQALNPTSRPGFEQNTREKSVCQMVKTSKYNKAKKGEKSLFEKVWGEPIDCKQQGDPPAYHISFKRLAVAVRAWQASKDVNSFTSPRDACISGDPVTGEPVDADGKFPCDNLSDEANLGHDIFYGRNDCGDAQEAGDPEACGGLKNRIVVGPQPPAPFGPPREGPKWAVCSFCHGGVPEGEVVPVDDDGIPTGNAPRELYADHFFHCIGQPFNREIPTTGFQVDKGLAEHTGDDGDAGCSKTPSVRNAAKNLLNITKNFFRNGYFKDLEQVVHFYNTSLSKPDCAIDDATAGEAMAADCWPEGEFAPAAGPPNAPVLFGALGLTCKEGSSAFCPAPEEGDVSEEEALIAYIEALNDAHTPEPPSTVK